MYICIYTVIPTKGEETRSRVDAFCSQRFFARFYPSAMLELPYYVPSNFPKIFVLVCTVDIPSLQNPNISGTILKKRNSRHPSNMFPRVKTPAAYVRVRCYPC